MDQSTRRPLKVGIFLPFAEYMMDRQTPQWSDLVTMTQRAEALGFDSVWLSDHRYSYKVWWVLPLNVVDNSRNFVD